MKKIMIQGEIKEAIDITKALLGNEDLSRVFLMGAYIQLEEIIKSGVCNVEDVIELVAGITSLEIGLEKEKTI